MQLGTNIRENRNRLGLSQEQLAEKVFVSRQTISNWENDKSCPDINSLVLMSEVFSVSVDTLIKGDVEEMKKEISKEDRTEFERLSKIFAPLLIACILTPIPMAHFMGWIGIALWAVLMAVTIYFSVQLEKKKKQLDIQTYREIVAFTEGKSLDEITKAREEGKRPYQKILLGVAAGLITLILAVVFAVILK